MGQLSVNGCQISTTLVGKMFFTLLVLWSIVYSQAWDGSEQRQLNVFNFHDHQHNYDTMRLDRFISRINQTVDPIVDARLERMAQAIHPGNFCPFRVKVLDKLIKGETVNIVIVGGSVTYGAELRDRMTQRWSHPFEQMLNSKWFNGSINVNNIAMGACNVDSWIARAGRIPAADLLIVDLSTNDQGFDVQALPHFYRTFIQLLDDLPFHPAILFNLAYRSGQNHADEIAGHCPAANQSISCCGGAGLFCKRWWDMSEYVASVLKEYKIPYVSYKELTWPDYWSPPDNLNLFWNGLSHPDYKAHALMAKLIALGFYTNIRASSHKHVECAAGEVQKYVQAHQRDESIKPLCPHPLTAMAGTDQADSVSSFALSGQPGKDWAFFSDSKQKYGYILQSAKCSSCEGSAGDRTLSLSVTLGDDPVIQLFYLKSFSEEMGPVSIWMDEDRAAAITLDGKWNLRTDGDLAYHDSYRIPFSVTRVATLSKGTLSHISSYVKGDQFIIPGLTPGPHVLHLAAHKVDSAKLKFKLIGLTTC